MVEEKEGYELAGVIEPLQGQKPENLGGFDVIIDFSNPANLQMLADYCRANSCPAVIATTGFEADQLKEIEKLAEAVPVVFSANYSLGINVMKRVIAEITPILEDTFDIEIIEKHHNRKRGKEIGVHAIRGGTIAGEHTVIYAGTDEILEVKHTAGSKKIFAAGALKAAAFAVQALPGLYSMEDVLFGTDK